MCWNLSQILAVVGLVFQFFSFAMTVRTVFWDVKRYIEERILHKSISKYRVTREIKPRDIEIAIVLLIIGMVFQGISLFV
jgi:hypothetical protein